MSLSTVWLVVNKQSFLNLNECPINREALEVIHLLSKLDVAIFESIVEAIFSVKNGFFLFIELKKITDYGYQSILVEGGGKISASLLSNNLADKIYWFKASKFIGQEGISAIDKLGIHDMKSIKKFNLSKIIKLEDDTLNIFIKK